MAATPLGDARPAPASGALPAHVLERVLSRLLQVQGAEAAEREVVRVLEEATGAAWVAVFRREASGLAPCGCSAQAPAVVREEAFAARLSDAFPSGAPPREDSLGACRLVTAEGERGRVALLEGGAGILDEEAERELLGYCGRALGNADLVEELREQVLTDSLTGCFNRRGFDDHLRVEIVRARRYRRPLSLVLLDIDDFKGVNDQLGHAAGDTVLRAVSRLLVDAFRTTDRVCRYGGDEFAVIFPETPPERVLQLAERLRAQIAARFPDGEIDCRVSASFGVAGYPADGNDPDSLLRAADRALYTAKTSGRDRVVPG